MKRATFAIWVLCVLWCSISSAQSPRDYYYSGRQVEYRQAAYYAPYYVDYRPSFYGPRVCVPSPPPAYAYPVAVRAYSAPRAVPYYYQTRNGVYYSNPRFSVGVDF